MEAQASLTAIGAAATRATHLLLDAEPKIFRDDFALRFSGYDDEVAFRETTNAMLADIAAKIGPENAQRLTDSVRGAVLLRSRFAEDSFHHAMTRGVTRLVILGAGLDSFAWRHPNLANEVDVFEIDHPASQQWKQQRLRELRLEQPENLTFVPVDFEKQTFVDGLRAAGFPMDKPAFFSWLGVTPYLKRETVLDTLKQVAGLAPGTEIAFTLLVQAHLLTEHDRQVYEMTAAGAAARNEPFLALFDPMELAERMREIGYTQIKHLDYKTANATYFAGRSDGLRYPSMDQLILARTG